VVERNAGVKETFRQSMSWLHTWAGLTVGWVLYFIFLTGTLGYFDTEIDRWMRPERPLTQHTSIETRVAVALRRLHEVASDAELWLIDPAGDRENPDLRIYYRPRPDAGAPKEELLDPTTGKLVTYRETGGGQVLYQMHYELHYLPTVAAYWTVGLCAMFMLLAIVTGVIVHKKIFKDFFTFRPGKQQRSWLDAHNVLAVVALPFHFMITYSGLLFLSSTYMPLVVAATYGMDKQGERTFLAEFIPRQTEVKPAGTAAPLAPLAPILARTAQEWGPHGLRYIEVRNPGDANARITVARALATPLRNSERLVFDGVSGALLEIPATTTSVPRTIREVFLGLHEGLFAGLGLRWLYFLSGLLGVAMIGTGLMLWTVKRERDAHRSAFGWALVHRLNIGTIVGLPIGIAAYFWANRLIPADLAGRAQWEVHALFITWGLLLVHAHCRPLAKAWPEQLWIAAAAFGLLPVLNALTTQRHLGVTLPHGDWVLAGMDLTLLVVGLTFAATALKARAQSMAAQSETITTVAAENAS
jgi:uncharacterized iron-regulated membrane protein